MYLIDDTYFQSPKREIPNLDEADSRAFAELELLIDEKCRLLLLGFLTVDEFQEFDGFLDDGIFPEDTTGIPQKWIDLVNGTEYELNGVTFKWSGLLYELGTYKGSLLVDYVYSFWIESQASYMTGVGDAKANPKGANSVNPTQRYVNTWNDFFYKYQYDLETRGHFYRGSLQGNFANFCFTNKDVSLLKFINDHKEDYTSTDIQYFEVKNQLGL